MLKGKDFGKQPENMKGNMTHAMASGTPSTAVGRDGGAMPKSPPSEVTRDRVPIKSLTKQMPGA